MTPATSMQGPPDRPGRRIRHSWRCTRRAPVVETTRRAGDGRLYVVEHCTECERDDLAERLADRLLPGDGPEAA